MTETFVSVVIPALNEEKTVGAVVKAFRNSSFVQEVIVVDNGSDDLTAKVALETGARLLSCPQRGLGRALKLALSEANSDWIFKVDADMRNPTDIWLKKILEQLDDHVGMVKGYWDYEEDPLPVTRLVAKPAITTFFPQLQHIKLPLGGIYLVNRRLLDPRLLSDEYSFDLGAMLQVSFSGKRVEQIDLGIVKDRLRPLEYYSGMAENIMNTVRRFASGHASSRLLVIAAHSDDAEIWCGGTLIKHCVRGGSAKIIIAQAPQPRRDEALRSRDTLAGLSVDFLPGHSDPRSTIRFDEQRNALTEAIGTFRPDVLIVHHPADEHPDHREVAILSEAALLSASRHISPHKLFYMNSYFNSLRSRTPFRPNAFVDISREADLKYRLIEAFESQDTTFWIDHARKMDQLNGIKSGVALAEAFEETTFFTIPKAVDYLF